MAMKMTIASKRIPMATRMLVVVMILFVEFCCESPARDGTHDKQRLRTARNGFRQLKLVRFERQIFLASEEPDERPPLQGDMVANRAPQHGIPRFEGVEHRYHRRRAVHFELHFAVHARQRAQMKRKLHPDHGIVWTSTE